MPVEVVFFNVGQGDCTFLWFYDKPGDKVGTHAVLIDCGSSQKVDPLNSFRGKTGMVDRLDSKIADYMGRLKNPNVLDCLIITHPDEDHFNLLQDILVESGDPPQLKYRIDRFMYGLTPEDYKERGDNFVWTLIRQWRNITGPSGRRGIPNKPEFVTMPANPISLVKTTGGAELLMVGAAVGEDPRSKRKKPPKKSDEDKRRSGDKEAIANESSLVTLLQEPDGSGKQQRVLLMADAVQLNEDYLMLGVAGDLFKRESKLWLKLGHHGSKTSNSKEWLEYTTPDGLFVSTGVKVFAGGSGTCTKSSIDDQVLKTWSDVRKNNHIPSVQVSSGQSWGYVVHDDSNKNKEFVYTPTTEGLFSSMALPPVTGGVKADGDAANWRGVDWHLKLNDPAPGSYDIRYE